MPARQAAICVLTMAAFVLVASACREREAEDRYNYDLAADADDMRLLPSTATYHPAHDQAIRSGRTQATIVKRDDVEAVAEAVARAEPAPTGAAVELPPASGLAEAMGNVGKAFLGNLMGATAPPAAADAEAIGQLIDQYNHTQQAKDFPALVRHCVDRQQVVAQELFDFQDQLHSSVEALLEALEENSPDLAAEAKSEWGRVLGPVSISDLSPAGDGATATLVRAGGDVRHSVGFERADGAWRMVHPAVPAAADWPARRTAWENAIESVDEFYDTVLAGDALDENRLRSILQTAVSLMLGSAGG